MVLVPLISLPLLFVDNDDEKVRGFSLVTQVIKGHSFLFQIFQCAWVLVIMASYWVTEALPLAITSLIPVALLPTLGKGKLNPSPVFYSFSSQPKQHCSVP